MPEGTKSLALVCHDPDAPAKPANLNTEGKTTSARRKRTDFYHWLLVDLPADAVGIQEGEFSDVAAWRQASCIGAQRMAERTRASIFSSASPGMPTMAMVPAPWRTTMPL